MHLDSYSEKESIDLTRLPSGIKMFKSSVINVFQSTNIRW